MVCSLLARRSAESGGVSETRFQHVQQASTGSVLGQNPSAIAHRERGERWLAGGAKPWQPRGRYRCKRQADF